MALTEPWRRRRVARHAQAAALALLLAACGGNGGGGGTTSVTLAALPAWCGSMSPVGAFDQGDVSAGDSTANEATRAFLVFDLGALPPGVTIASALLRVHECSFVGTPYADLGGSLLVDHFDVGISIDVADFAGGDVTAPIGSLSNSTAFLCTPRSMDVTAQVQDDVASGRPRSAFRFRFMIDTDGDGALDFTSLADMFAGTVDPQPVIEVTYLP